MVVQGQLVEPTVPFSDLYVVTYMYTNLGVCKGGWEVEWGRALVTCMKSFYKIRSEIQGKINYLNLLRVQMLVGEGKGEIYT